MTEYSDTIFAIASGAVRARALRLCARCEIVSILL